MNDRGMIKWSPFNSVINTSNLVNDIENKRKYMLKPILSEEKTLEINNNIIVSYYNKTNIIIKYYFKGEIYTKSGILTFVNTSLQFIKINNFKINFSQILDISIN